MRGRVRERDGKEKRDLKGEVDLHPATLPTPMILEE